MADADPARPILPLSPISAKLLSILLCPEAEAKVKRMRKEIKRFAAMLTRALKE